MDCHVIIIILLIPLLAIFTRVQGWNVTVHTVIFRPIKGIAYPTVQKGFLIISSLYLMDVDTQLIISCLVGHFRFPILVVGWSIFIQDVQLSHLLSLNGLFTDLSIG